MDKNSKKFLLIFFPVAIIIIVIAFFKFYILKDFYIKLETPCDPETEKCFITECDPQSDSQCPSNPDERISYYKLINKKANTIPTCDSSDPNCPSIACSAGEDCQETLCDEATKAKDEECSDPEEYLKNKKETESGGGDCDLGDENCAESTDANSSDESTPEDQPSVDQSQNDSESGN